MAQELTALSQPGLQQSDSLAFSARDVTKLTRFSWRTISHETSARVVLPPQAVKACMYWSTRVPVSVYILSIDTSPSLPYCQTSPTEKLVGLSVRMCSKIAGCSTVTNNVLHEAASQVMRLWNLSTSPTVTPSVYSVISICIILARPDFARFRDAGS